MKLQDLVFREAAGALPRGAPCNYCGERGATLFTEIPISGGHTAIVALCSRSCESALKREEDGDKWLDGFLAEAAEFCKSQEWPEEIDA